MNRNQYLVNGFQLEHLELIFTGVRDDSFLRDKSLHIDNESMELIQKEMDANISRRRKGMHVEVDYDGAGTTRLLEVNSKAEISNDWSTARYLVIATFSKFISQTITEVTVVQGFTDHNEIYVIRNGQKILDLDATVYINKISTFRDVNSDGMIPALNFNVILDRFGTMVNSEGETNMFLQKASTMFEAIENNRSQLEIEDDTLLVDETVDTVSGKQGMSGGLGSRLAYGAINGALATNTQNTNKVASIKTGDHTIFATDFVEAICKYYHDDTDRVLSPYKFEIAMLAEYCDNVSDLTEVFEDFTDDDARFVDVADGGEQLYLHNDAVEIRYGSLLSEALAAIIMDYGLKTIEFEVIGISTESEYYKQTGLPNKTTYDGLSETLFPNLHMMTAKEAVGNTISEFAEEVEKVLHKYDGDYYVKVTVLNLAFCEIQVGVGGQPVVAATHSAFADSLTSSAITTGDNLDDNIRVVDKLSTVLQKQVLLDRVHSDNNDRRTTGGRDARNRNIIF